MSEFDDVRNRYNAARIAAQQLRTEMIRAHETVKRLERKVTTLKRQAGARSEDIDTELQRTQRELDGAKTRTNTKAADFAKQSEQLEQDLKQFSEFSDPTLNIAQWSDDTPIALLPLRLETRFKTVQVGNETQLELWVRVFPDDILVDSFQPEISETELANISTYWVHRWRSGGDVEGHRAAWAAMVRSHGAGRARWLLDQYQPLNPGDEPSIAEHEIVIIITPPVPVPEDEKQAIGEFWSRVWLSQGVERESAFVELENSLGSARALVVLTELVPENLFDVAVKPDGNREPVVVFLDLPGPDSLPLSVDDWTRGATTWLLPERFVLLGFQGGQEVIREIGAAIPAELQVGPDPSAPDDLQIRGDGDSIQFPDSMSWMVDFEAAVAQGMGFKVNLKGRGIKPKFDRLFVLGLRLENDAEEGKNELGTLISHHQSSRKGFEILPQGRPTNNTDASKSGYSWWVDPDQSFAHFFESDEADDPKDWRTRKDGAWLAGLLGIDPEIIRVSPNYYGTDQAEARAMNTALWPATLGYYMEQMMEPVFSEETVHNTRNFFNRFVIGRGTLPLVRVGRQPYAVLPATVWSKMSWWRSVRNFDRRAGVLQLPVFNFLDDLQALLNKVLPLWESFVPNIAHVGNPGDDGQQTLLDILGLHPSSAEFYQRYSQSFIQHYNTLGFSTEPVNEALALELTALISAGLKILAELGWDIPQDSDTPELLEKVFHEKANLLKGPLVQQVLSDLQKLDINRADGLNYIEWLQTAALDSHDILRKQDGFTNGPPNALLYLLLRHALDLGFIDTGLQLRRNAMQWSQERYLSERKEPKFIHINDQHSTATSSRWEALYRPSPELTGDDNQHLGDFIATILQTRDPYLNQQIRALDILKTASSASLERALVEHLDCLSYRLDAWRIAMQAAQLSHMRQESDSGFDKDGLFIGAYGWLEDVKPSTATLSAVELDDELSELFGNDNEPSLMQDSSNFGHIHAPSLDHAVTAAILRNGHRENATTEMPDLLAVDLSSERVRLAQQVIEGIRNGQSLGALLGYQLERLLHDEPDLFLDRLIYDLRREFPLAGNRLKSTLAKNIDSITRVEARNVIDGAALMDHIADKGISQYPYELNNLPDLNDFAGPGLPSATEIANIIDAHVDKMRSIGDAVGDLAIAEGVYQVVRGNYDRAGAALDAFSKGSQPPAAEVTATPRSGKTLTLRVALHLQGGLLPDSPDNTTVRAKAEPAIAQWLKQQMPDPATIFARVSWHDNVTDQEISLTPSMHDLGLAPVDLFYLVDAGGAKDMPGFDDLLIDHAILNGTPAPDDAAVFSLQYKPDGITGLSLFELAPLVRSFRGALLGARPIRATDIVLQNEASTAEEIGLQVRSDKVVTVITDFQSTLPTVEAVITALDAVTAEAVDAETARDLARDNIDQWIIDYTASVRPVLAFGLQAASLTVATEARRAPFEMMLKALDDLLVRWDAKRTDYDSVFNSYSALPADATDDQRTALLIRAGRIISTQVIAPLPQSIALLETEVTALRLTFDNELARLQDLRDNAVKTGATLIAITALEPNIALIDQQPFELNVFRDRILALGRELHQKAMFLRDYIKQRIEAANIALQKADAAVDEKAQTAVAEAAKALLGEAFMILPEFTLANERLLEWDNVWSSRADLLAHLQTGPEASSYPVEDWLHSVSCVRERLRWFEMSSLLSDAFGVTIAPKLEALQFPYRPNDVWLGLKFPETMSNGEPFVFNEDKLLYCATFASGAEIDLNQPEKTYTGLILDEWVEDVPSDQETTGVAFHYNRPNAEASQAILLATPPVFKGQWQWDDLVATLHETLDFAKLRAVEPKHIDETTMATFVPAVLSTVTTLPITAALNFSMNNNLSAVLLDPDFFLGEDNE